MTCDTGKMSHLRFEIHYIHEDVRVLVHFAPLTDSSGKSCKITFQKKEVSETKQQLGLFLSVNNSRLQPMKPTGVVHIEDACTKVRDKLVQRSSL